MNPLRSGVRQISSASLRQRPDPQLQFDFVEATEKDLGQLVDLCCSDFIKVEPHSRALGLTANESRFLFNWSFAKSLHYPFSIKILEKSSGQLIGFRLMSIGHRDPSRNYQPYELDVSRMSKKLETFGKVMRESKERFWRTIDKDVEKVLRREITFVVEKHQKKGIARHLVHLGLDFDQLRKDGVQGIVSEASSIANQNLLRSEGYECLVEPKYKWAERMDDGTEGVKVFFKDLRM